MQFIGGMIVGATVGVLVMALCFAAGNDRRDGE